MKNHSHVRNYRIDISTLDVAAVWGVTDQQWDPVVVEIWNFLLDESDLLSEEEECKHT